MTSNSRFLTSMILIITSFVANKFAKIQSWIIPSQSQIQIYSVARIILSVNQSFIFRKTSYHQL